MQKINFQNYPSTTTPIDADNLNDLQDNVEEAIDLTNNYSTTEKVVGTHLNKPLYRKMINFGELPNAQTKKVNHNISNLDEMVNLKGNFKDSSGTRFNIPYVYPDSSFASYYITFTETTNTQIGIATGVDRSAYSGYVTMEYTKTTD